jgi:hypothetical protein
VARFNEILVGRYNRFLQKLLTLKGGPPAPQLASEIGCGFVLFNGNENRYLEGWGLFGATTVVNPGGVGTTAAVQLRNPTPSNVIASITKVQVTPVTGGESFVLGIGGTNADLTTPGAGNRFDRRGIQASACIPSQTTSGGVSPLSTIGRYDTLVNVTYDLILHDAQEIPLAPGDAFRIDAQTTNQTFRLIMWWRERFLEESERS